MPSDADAGKLLLCDVQSAEGKTPVRSANAVLAKALMIDDTDESIQYPEGSLQDTADAPYLAGNKPYNNTITYFKDGDVNCSLMEPASFGCPVTIRHSERQLSKLMMADRNRWKYVRHKAEAGILTSIRYMECPG